MLVDEAGVLFSEITVEKHHVRPAQQRVQIHIGSDGPALVTGIRVAGQDLHAQGLDDGPGGSANAAEADDPGGLSGQFDQRIVPVAPVRVP